VESFDGLASLIFTKLQEAHITATGPSAEGPSTEASGPSVGDDKASKDKSKSSKGSKGSKSNKGSKEKGKESASSKEGGEGKGEGEGDGEGLFDESRVALFEVLRYCEADPTAASWVAYYDDLQVRRRGEKG
jgi:hypothetical protein